MNNDISAVGNYIFDSKYERALVLNRSSLDMICAPSVGEEQASKFEKNYYTVRYIYIGGQLKTGNSNISTKTKSESFVLIYEWLKVII